MEDKEEKKKEVWEESTIATQTAPVIVNTKENKQYDVTSAMVKVLNNQEKMMILLGK